MSDVRVYGAADVQALRALADDQPVTLDYVIAASADEEDEYDALMTAAEDGPVVVCALVEADGAPVRLEDLQSLHVDADGSGDLAWYAPQELDDVIELLGA
ncbi:hypothetical protein H9L21_04420 [Aeromicrobium senzhongii]|uniref:Uncharacterized protein n=1 Tax=Aeromicrobium senzhongii TaxID=2663859 RepID=A0ABX6SUV9_9ACTN|nr:hypothetical protein [Aeromicrobium senzhongii]MTB87787.1 hypothetical protein [Aeromicrobium senzhongii]QNL95189.1 hypothetical protein H9L21_04420 [Aeromicrobium senzhongii]